MNYEILGMRTLNEIKNKNEYIKLLEDRLIKATEYIEENVKFGDDEITIVQSTYDTNELYNILKGEE